MAHAVVIGPMALHRLFTLPNVGSLEKAFGWEESMGRLHGIAVGFCKVVGETCNLTVMIFYSFVWDTIESVVAQAEVGPLMRVDLWTKLPAFHGLLWSMCSRLGAIDAFLKWYLDKLQMTGGLLQAINGFILLSLFFAVRVCYGIYVSFDFFHTLVEVRGTIPAGLALTYGGGNLALNVLNLFWYARIRECPASIEARLIGSPK
ncbi:hypothetical protein FRC10_011187 [Ceratobasidium sp. 414]|nr:hypothetical protein FRC10_011187 [Ceratobasidium sp. 414]